MSLRQSGEGETQLDSMSLPDTAVLWPSDGPADLRREPGESRGVDGLLTFQRSGGKIMPLNQY